MSEVPKLRGNAEDDRLRLQPPKLTAQSASLKDFSANWKKLQRHLEEEKLKESVTNDKEKAKLPHVQSTRKRLYREHKTQDRWFEEDPPPKKSILTEGQSSSTATPEEQQGMTKYIAIDCEMVGTGTSGDASVLARCSVVNSYGHVLLDEFVKPKERVTDFRTKYSGIRPRDLKKAVEFSEIQKEVAEMSKGRILVGHAIHHDLKVLMLSHPHRDIRDTSKYKPFRVHSRGKTPSLKKLAKIYLQTSIQDGEHNSVEDAWSAMRIFLLHKKEWERSLRKSSKWKKTGS